MAEAVRKKSKKRIVSAKTVKHRNINVSPEDPMFKSIAGFFDEALKKEFAQFLAEKNNVIPISKAKKKGSPREYKKEGREPMSFREITSYKNPLFAAPGKYSPAEYNPETIDIDTFDLMRRDHQLSIGLAVIKMPIVSLPWRVNCEDEEIRKTTEWALKRIWRDLIKSSLMAVDYGFSSHEKVWERDNIKISKIDKAGKETVYHNGDLVYFKKIKPHHPGSIKIKFNDRQEIEEVIQESGFGGEDIILPVRKTYIFTNDKEFGNPFGVSRLKNAYKIWYWKELLYQFMMQYFERRGTPSTVATVPPGQSQDSSGTEMDNLEIGLRMATSLISSSVAVLPYQQSKDGRENMWNLSFLSDDARGSMFVEALNHLDSRCLRAIFVPEGVVGGSSSEGGTSGGSTVHADIFLMTEKGLIADLEESINKQIVKPFVEANYPPEKIKECRIKLDPLDFSRKITLKEIFMEVIRNQDTMIQMGIAPTAVPSIDKLSETLEIPMETWEDATGLTREEFTEKIEERNSPNSMNGNKDKNDNLPSKKSNKVDKIAGRKKTRRKSVDQTLDRRKVNPSGRRTERNRESNPERKSK